jgi:hypothetical protein
VEFPYKDYVIIHFLDRKCLTCLVDVMIVGSVLTCYSSFVVAHKLFEARKNEILGGTAIPGAAMTKLKAYLWISIVANFALVCVLLPAFKNTDTVLLFLFTCKVC